MTITPTQFARLTQIALEAQDGWNELRALEREAVAITGEELNGYTSDLIWQSDANVERILEALGITVEGVT